MTNSFPLPDASSPDLHLVLATPKELLAQQISNCSEWSGILNQEQYIRREEILSSQDLTKDGGLSAWMLVYQPKGSQERHVLCGCETIRKKAMVARGGVIEDSIIHGIGSVFCPPEFRGRRYANRMMTEVGRTLRDWQSTKTRKSLGSLLYSDIGKKFYGSLGWKLFPSAHVALRGQSTVKDGVKLPQVRLLKADDLPELCELDEQKLRRSLQASSTGTSFAVTPDLQTIRWHHAREEFIAKSVFDRRPDVKGAICGDDNNNDNYKNGARVWCYWTRVFVRPNEPDEHNTLHILRLGVEEEERTDRETLTRKIAALFGAAQREAAQWGMEHVELWNPSAIAVEAARIADEEARVEQRQESSLPMLQWSGSGDVVDGVEWVANEKYAWC